MIRQKEQDKILNDLIKIVKDKLSNDFKNRKQRLIVKVESVRILDFKINQDENDRDKVFVSNIQAYARVFVNFAFGSTSSDDIVLKSNKPVGFIYSRDIDNFELNDASLVEFYDATPN